MTDILDIALLHRPSGKVGRGAFYTERFSIDFVVNGRSLRDWLKLGDMSGAFLAREDNLHLRSKVNSDQRRLFTSFAERPVRVAVFVCPECGDLGCGAITLDLACTSDKVLWSRFGYENDYNDQMSDFESYKDIGPFEFEIGQYLDAIARAEKG